jgi:crossover junction endodeoxyribonuclease RusA
MRSTPLTASTSTGDIYEVTLDIPVSQNHCYMRRYKGYVKNGRKKRRAMNVLTPKAAAWMEKAKDECVAAMKECRWTPIIDQKVVVEMVVYWPDRRRRDAHNLSKLLCDCLEGCVANDDRYFLLRVMDYGYDKGNPRVEVRAYRHGEELS